MRNPLKTFSLACVLAFICSFAAIAAAAPMPSSIAWHSAGSLPAAFGEKQNIGVAGMVYGQSNGYVIIGGGANFPEKGPALGGHKKTYSDIYVYRNDNGRLILTDHGQMPFPIAYGASVLAPEGVYYVGGSTDPVGAKTISLLSVTKKGLLQIKKIAELPFTFQNGIACYDNGSLYLGLGKQDGKTSTAFYRYDLKTGQLQTLAPFPSGLREQSVAQILDNKLCVFGGGSKIAYTDGYGYDLRTGHWQKLAAVKYAGNNISLLGAASVKLNAAEMLVIGGFNKPIYDWAVQNLSTLKGPALANFKNVYFNAATDFFQWNNQVLLYNVRTNTWRSLGTLPFAAPCGEALILDRANQLICANGEIKPGVRANVIHIGTLHQ